MQPNLVTQSCTDDALRTRCLVALCIMHYTLLHYALLHYCIVRHDMTYYTQSATKVQHTFMILIYDSNIIVHPTSIKRHRADA